MQRDSKVKFYDLLIHHPKLTVDSKVHFGMSLLLITVRILYITNA